MATKKIATNRASQEDITAIIHEKLVEQNINAPKTLSKTVWKAALSTVTELLQKGNDVELHGIGTLSLRGRDAYIGRNPRTGAAQKVEAKISVGFVPSSVLKKALNPKK